MKKRDFGVGRWNGAGGKVYKGESLITGLKRETKEEIGVKLIKLTKVADIDFYFPEHKDWDQKMHAYICDKWEGEPMESEEMKPKWFAFSKIPFDAMWPDDMYWLPQVLTGKLVKGEFTLGAGDRILKQKVEEVEKL